MKPLRTGDIYPSDVLRDQYGMNTANRPTIIFDSDGVPETLLPLRPYVERWAISCDVTRGDYFDKQPVEDIAEFFHAVKPYVGDIRKWLSSQPATVADWPPATHQFVCLIKAYHDAYQPTEEELLASQSLQEANKHARDRKAACEEAMEKFRVKDYVSVVELLRPFANDLDKVTKAKFTFACKKV